MTSLSFFSPQEGTDEEREVRQFQYVSWPDFGVPLHSTPLLYFLHRVREVHHYNSHKPMAIHCRYCIESAYL